MASNNQAAGLATTNSAASGHGSSNNQSASVTQDHGNPFRMSPAVRNLVHAEITGIETRMNRLAQAMDAVMVDARARQDRLNDELETAQRELQSKLLLLSVDDGFLNLQARPAEPPATPPVSGVTSASSANPVVETSDDEPQGTDIAVLAAGPSAARTFSQRSSDGDSDSNTATQEAVHHKQPRLESTNEQESSTVSPAAQLPVRRNTVVYRGSQAPFTPAQPAFLDNEPIRRNQCGSAATPALTGLHLHSAPLSYATTPGPSTRASGFGTRVSTPFPSSASNAGTTDSPIMPRGCARDFKTGSNSSTPTKPQPIRPIIRPRRHTPNPFIDPKTYRQPRVPGGSGGTGNLGVSVSTSSTGSGGGAGAKQYDSRFSPRKGDTILLPFNLAPEELQGLRNDDPKSVVIKRLQKKATRPKENPLRAEQERLFRSENPDKMDVDDEE